MEAIKAGLADGTIDAIATDHAPHTDSEKDVEFDCAPFGIIGLQTALSLGITELVDKKILAEDVHGCLGKLAPKYREVMQLVYFEHMKYEEASDVLHVPTSTIGVWLSRAKSQLREICKKRGVRR